MARKISRNFLRSVIPPSLWPQKQSVFPSRLTDKRRPDATPALRPTPGLGTFNSR